MFCVLLYVYITSFKKKERDRERERPQWLSGSPYLSIAAAADGRLGDMLVPDDIFIKKQFDLNNIEIV